MDAALQVNVESSDRKPPKSESKVPGHRIIIVIMIGLIFVILENLDKRLLIARNCKPSILLALYPYSKVDCTIRIDHLQSLAQLT